MSRFSLSGTVEPSHICDWNVELLASCHLIGLMREQRTHPLIQILLGAVIGVQSDGDVRVFRSHFMCESRQRQRAGNAIIDPPAGDVRPRLPRKSG